MASNVHSLRTFQSASQPFSTIVVLHKLSSQRTRFPILSPIQPGSTQSTSLGLINNTKKRVEVRDVLFESSNLNLILEQLTLELISFRQKGHLIECSLADSAEPISRCTPEAWTRNRIKLIPMMLTSLSANALSKRLDRSQTFGGGCGLSRGSAYP